MVFPFRKLNPIIIKVMAITVSAPTLVSFDTFILNELNNLLVKLAKKLFNTKPKLAKLYSASCFIKAR
jgi:hypothetical protein